MSDENWTTLHARIRSEDVLIDTVDLDDTAIPGLYAILATVPELPMPIGVLWWRFRDKDTIEIVDCYVKEEVRRAGVFAKMLLSLRVHDMPRIWTWTGSPHGGLAAIKALGFKEAERGWLLEPPAKEKTPDA